jgi:hypothetical protein
MTRSSLIMGVAALLAAALVGVQGAAAATPAQSNPVSSQTFAGRQSTLPFTGIDVALLSSGGAGLLLLGASVRRLGRQQV